MQDDGKYASRFSAKPSGGLCAVLPKKCREREKMIKIVAEHFVKEESRDSFIVLARDLVNESRKETGNISYHLCVDRADQLHFTFIEEWQDTNAIKAHNSSIHFSRIVPQLRECAAKAGNSCFYDELY